MASLGTRAAAVGLAIATAGCSGLLGIDDFSDRDAGSSGGAGGSTGGAGGSTGGAGGSTGGAGGSTGGAGGSLPTLRVFVTDEPQNGYLVSLEDADLLCTSRAAAGAPTQGGARWQAWLSTTGSDGVSAVDRFTDNCRWALPEGPVVFENRFQLFDGTGPHQPINRDQHGNVIDPNDGTAVWTGTTAGGHAAPNDCSRWATAIGTMRGAVGDCWSDDHQWTDDGTPLACNQPARVYCFEMPPED